ncbi:Nin1 binding protein [Cladochytrium tenue]|nr:Nin1 binding protein [Cladochytrium tenue]
MPLPQTATWGSVGAVATTAVAAAAHGPGPSSSSSPLLPGDGDDGRPVQALVVDSAPILQGINLGNLGSELFTIPEVVAEIKDESGRANLNIAKSVYGLRLKAPSDEAVRAVSDFSKKTGDFATLSRTDIRVLALTWMLEKERRGTAHIRTAPVKPSANTPGNKQGTSGGSPSASPRLKEQTKAAQQPQAVPSADEPVHDSISAPTPEPAADTFQDNHYWAAPLPDIDVDLAELGLAPAPLVEIAEPEAKAVVEAPAHKRKHLHKKKANKDTAAATELAPSSDKTQQFNDNNYWSLPLPEIDIDLSSLSLEAATETTVDASVESTRIGEKGLEPVPTVVPQAKHAEPVHEVPDELEEQEDDGEGEWITPSNIAKKKAKMEKQGQKTRPQKGKMAVACITSDFAMQNVLLQMNLCLLSVDGMRITKLKSFVLRCHACYKITTDMEKKFCPSCGNSTLLRASCSVASDGSLVIHLKKNFQYNIRGTKYNIPTSKGGRSDDLILREDQKEFQRALSRRSGKSSSSSTSGTDPFEMGISPLELPHKARVDDSLPTVGYGRKNPNDSRGRRKKK